MSGASCLSVTHGHLPSSADPLEVTVSSAGRRHWYAEPGVTKTIVYFNKRFCVHSNACNYCNTYNYSIFGSFIHVALFVIKIFLLR